MGISSGETAEVALIRQSDEITGQSALDTKKEVEEDGQ